MNVDEYYMKLALEEVKKALKKDEVPVGALIVSNNKIIARSHNLREKKGNVLKHAELLAISKASKKKKDWRLNDCTIYITLFPCPMCASAIVQSRISRVVIGAPCKNINDKNIVDLIFNSCLNKPKIEIKTGILEQECSDILKLFFKKQREIVKKSKKIESK